MFTKQNEPYLTPEVEVVEVHTEGAICEGSPRQNYDPTNDNPFG